ncbi:uncharacterized protein LOC110982463 isoform X2 [Acanthaster planci]|uniref:Uncharacterized protein LOC110982463 isoform X2 n=1 Tax=Acanthaster planci TaxID=133434 RepID=A0A8B7YZC9_ACAPL|nr:uncharacterized protein LOC110982463 isoform X2 [Acanthaster planci]
MSGDSRKCMPACGIGTGLSMTCIFVTRKYPPQTLFHSLKKKHGVFTPDMIQEITSKETIKDQTGKLLNMLEKRGQDAYRHFRSVLLETGYEHLVEKLDNTANNTADEIDGRAIRPAQQGISSTLQIRNNQGRQNAQHVTNNVIGNNNFAVFGGHNLTINHFNHSGSG